MGNLSTLAETGPQVRAGRSAGARDSAPGLALTTAYSFRPWERTWTPTRAGRHVLAVRATDSKGNVQPDAPVWNPGGYLWNRVERQALVVGTAS